MNSNDYKIVVDILFPNGNEEYVIWEPLMFGEMIEKGVNFNELFYNSPDAIRTPPLEVNIWLYHNPTLTTITQNIGLKMVIRQLLTGRKIFLIRSI